jgi:hypothetical protein
VRLSLASLSRVVYCLWARPGSYSRVEHLKANGVSFCFTNKLYTRLERLVWDKHSSLLRKFITYGRKKSYKIGPWCRYHKTFFTSSTYLLNKLDCFPIQIYFRLAYNLQGWSPSECAGKATVGLLSE